MNSVEFIWMFPLTFISSAFVAPENMPSWLQPIAEHNPFTIVTDASRALYNGRDPGNDVWLSIAWAIGHHRRVRVPLDPEVPHQHEPLSIAMTGEHHRPAADVQPAPVGNDLPHRRRGGRLARGDAGSRVPGCQVVGGATARATSPTPPSIGCLPTVASCARTSCGRRGTSCLPADLRWLLALSAPRVHALNALVLPKGRARR